MRENLVIGVKSFERYNPIRIGVATGTFRLIFDVVAFRADGLSGIQVILGCTGLLGAAMAILACRLSFFDVKLVTENQLFARIGSAASG